MKRVLFICSLYYPHVGGIETMIHELSKYYKSIGIESVVLTKRWPLPLSETDSFGDVKIYRVISARTENEFLEIAEWIKKNECLIKSDIVHIIGMRRPLPLVGYLLSCRWNVPLVSTVAGSEIPNDLEENSKIIWNEGKEIVRPVLELSNVVTCVSQSLMICLKKVCPDLLDVRTLYAGIDLPEINSNKDVKSFSKKYIVSLRRLFASKGINVLIKAFKNISIEYPDIQLLIAGDGPERKNLEQLVETLNLSERVIFIGTVSFKDALGLLRGAICTVVPSLFEGGGLVNVEAQAVGCPVIASRVGGIPEYVEDGVGGLLFEPGDYYDLESKIRLIIEDLSLRNKIITGGLEFSKKFDWQIIGLQYVSLYNELIANKEEKRLIPFLDILNKMFLIITKYGNNR